MRAVNECKWPLGRCYNRVEEFGLCDKHIFFLVVFVLSVLSWANALLAGEIIAQKPDRLLLRILMALLVLLPPAVIGWLTGSYIFKNRRKK